MSIFKRDRIDFDNIPKSVAFIIDGNGRWAKRRFMPRMFGHKEGIEAVKKTIKYASELGIKELLFFCFSTENWNRPILEVNGLFDLFRDFLKKEKQNFLDKGFKFKLVGDKSQIPSDIVEMSENIERLTNDCDVCKVGLCINYGGRRDIINAVNKVVKQNLLVTEESFSKLLYTGDFCDPDLIIRTSGEQRISNFLLYQMAYSEFYFTKTFWPDFDKKELNKAIIDYQKRNRRFGAIKE